MRISASTLVDAVTPYLVAPLISRASREALCTLADALPACAESVGFEGSLGADDGVVDLGLSVTPQCGGRSVLSGDIPDARLERAVAFDGRWQRLKDFACEWQKPTSTWAERVAFLFLEFDADGPCGQLPVPSVFAALDWPLAELTPQARERNGFASPASAPGLRAATAVVNALSGGMAAGTNDLFNRGFRELPDGGVMLHVAVMLSRPGQDVRLSAAVPRVRAASYLRSLGWAGSRALDDLLDNYAPYTDFENPMARVQLDFDVGTGIGRRIGVTLRPLRRSTWPALLDVLVSRGLCRPAKRRALLGWPGITLAQLSGVPCVLEHYLSHVKLSCGADDAPHAKVYFGVTPRPLARR